MRLALLVLVALALSAPAAAQQATWVEPPDASSLRGLPDGTRRLRVSAELLGEDGFYALRRFRQLQALSLQDLVGDDNERLRRLVALPALRELELSFRADDGATLNAAGWRELAKLRPLRALRIDATRTADGLAELARLPALRALAIEACDDALARELAKLTRLERLHLGPSSTLSASGITALAELPLRQLQLDPVLEPAPLRALAISGLPLDGLVCRPAAILPEKALSALGRLPLTRLELLDLPANRAAELLALRRLVWLRIRPTALDSAALQAIARMPKLATLELFPRATLDLEALFDDRALEALDRAPALRELVLTQPFALPARSELARIQARLRKAKVREP